VKDECFLGKLLGIAELAGIFVDEAEAEQAISGGSRSPASSCDGPRASSSLSNASACLPWIR
jgi:hypothetical protein